MDFTIFQYPILTLQASLDGILLGILFALIAYGMALQWGVMNIINIAQGELVIMGGYIAYFMYLSGLPSYLWNNCIANCYVFCWSRYV